MALSANQQTQYNQLIGAGASQSAAMNAAMLVPDTTAAPSAPATQTTQPAPQTQSPASPTSLPSISFPSTTPQSTSPTPQPVTQQPTTQSPQPTTQPTQTTSTTPPTVSSSLAPGSTGQDVQQLQNYLVQMGYLTPQQVATGAGTYGPATTAAVAKLQQDLGLNPSSGQGYFGPQTQQALAQKYQSLHQQMSGNQVPDSSAEASAALTSALTPQNTDPVFGSMASMMEPIMNSLTQVLQNINNPALTATSLQSEYNDLASQYNIPGMQASLLNMQNVMNGTTQDIRDEVTKSGGFVTESQVQAMSAARNTVLMKQYNSLSSQYQAAQTNVSNMMQYAAQDQQTELQRQQMTATITGSMASIESQMMQMGMTMQNNARSAVQYNVTQMGYQGLAQSAQGNPEMLGYYENMLGLAPGTLSDPNAVAQMDTYKNQQLQLNNYRAAIAAYQAGYGGGMVGGTSSGTPGTSVVGQVGVTPVDTSTLVRPSFVSNDVPLTMSAQQMEQYMSQQKSASIDSGTNNIVAPGIGYYLQQSDGSYVLKSALPSPSDQQYNQIKQTIASAQPFSGSPTVTSRWTNATNKELSAFKSLGTYQVLSSVAPYMANIRAAQVNPGSISDLELLDSYVRLSKGGSGQVTGDQVDIALKGASIADSVSVLEQKLQNGGILSDNQRQQLVQLASNVYNENASDYKNLYVQAIQGLQAEGVPVQFWSNLPDLNSLLSANQ